MGLLDDNAATEIARTVKNARNAAAGAVEEVVTRQATRLRSDIKTRKSAATRERIMAAATELMVESGGTDFQMSEVSSRCNMSKGSLYYYFADKNALVQSIFDRLVDDLVDQIESAVAKAPSALESITQLSHVLSAGMRPGSPLALAMTREILESNEMVLPSMESRLARIISILSAQFDRAKEEGVVRPDIDSRLGALAIAGAFTFAVLERPAESIIEDADEFSSKLVHLAFEGMGTEKGKEQLGFA